MVNGLHQCVPEGYQAKIIKKNAGKSGLREDNGGTVEGQISAA
jgi:hypothetical protein